LPGLANWKHVEFDTETRPLRAGFCTGETATGYAIMVPHWFPTMAIAILAAIPWLRWSKRFSLRALLIATTLVALVLGLVVWALQ
jgi:hypothetical protein